MNKFRFIGLPPRRTSLTLFAALAFGALASPANAANGTWTNLNGGGWNATPNWKSGIVADGSGNTADFSTLTLATAPVVTLDGARTIGNLLFSDLGNRYGWTLNPGNAGVLTLAGTTPTITVGNQTAVLAVPLAGTASLTKAGAGTLTLAGIDSRTAGATLVSAGLLRFLNPVNTSANAPLTVAAIATAQITAPLNLNVSQNSSLASTNVLGAGTLQLTATNSGPLLPDLYFGPDHNGPAYWGAQIATRVDLGNAQRFIHAKTGHNGVGKYGLLNADAQFAGSMVGSGGLTLIAQMTWTATSPAMEVPFCLDASNSFTGPLELQRGSVYLGHPQALTRTNTLFLNAAPGNNARFFLYGNSTTVADLSSSSGGNNTIANGNEKTGASLTLGPAALTVWQYHPGTFWGSLLDTLPEYDGSGTGTTGPLELIKNGPASLTLVGTNSFTGGVTINAGRLAFNGASTGGGTVTVANGATLGGLGTITAPVLVAAGGTVEAGFSGSVGVFAVNQLTLGSGSADVIALNFNATPAGVSSLSVLGGDGLTNNATVTINLLGTLPANTPAVYNLINWSGALPGQGSFALGSLPNRAVAYLTNNPAVAALQLVVTKVTVASVTWTGNAPAAWNLQGALVWTVTGTNLPAAYADGDQAVFDDAATNFVVNLTTPVSPNGVLIANSVHDYTFSGIGAITGYSGLLKMGSARLTLGISNSYSGPTTVGGGILTLGAAGALPGGAGAGNVSLAGTLDLAGFSTTLNNLTGSGVIDNLAASANPSLTLRNTLTTTFDGRIQNTRGALNLTVTGGGNLTLSGTNIFTGPTTVQAGTLTVNGSLDGSALTVSGGAALGGTGRIAGPVSLATGATLNLTANAPLTLGPSSLAGPVSVHVSGPISATNAATYVLLQHAARTGPGSFLLAPISNLFNTQFTSTLVDTNQQLLLVVAPAGHSGTLADVRHVVIFMQENRSFDHYFGSLHGVRGFDDRAALTLSNGNNVFYQPNGAGYVLPFHTSIQCLSDLGHDWSSTHQAWNTGNWNQWIAAKSPETMAFLNRTDLPYYYALADNFTVCDSYHCSTFTSTNPNRLLAMTGTIDPDGTGGGPITDNSEPAAGFRWTTYPERLQNAGVSWKVYQAANNFDDNALAWFAAYKQASPGNPLYDRGMTFVSDLVGAFQSDVTNNQLPAVSWVIAADYASEHPVASPASGEALTKQLLDALAANPAVYNSTVFILNYDENDGFFDHETPVTPPAGTPGEFVGGQPIGLGVRVPAIIVSPWSHGGNVCSQVFDHTSVLRFLEQWTGVVEPNISAWRRQVCGDLTSAFDFAHPATNYPALVGVAPINCASGTTATPPVVQTVPAQESGTLMTRALPYQPNVFATTDCSTGNFVLSFTNSGAASVHFSLYANAFRTDGPWPCDVPAGGSFGAAYNTTSGGGNYDFTAYGPDGFVRRFAGNVSVDCGQLEASLALNATQSRIALQLANPGAAPALFRLTNGYATGAGSYQSYSVYAHTTNVVVWDLGTNQGWYDFTLTVDRDARFLRRLAGHLQTNAPPPALLSSAPVTGFRDPVTFTAQITGFGTPSGTVQFQTNGTLLGTPVPLDQGRASVGTAGLPRGTNIVTAIYSGDWLNPPATNALTQIITNHPPLVPPVSFARLANLPLRIPFSGLLGQASDPDGDPVILQAVGGLSSLGTAVTTNAQGITYASSTNQSPDSFSFAVGDGWGALTAGTAKITVVPAPDGETIATILPVGGSARVNFAAIPNYTYILQRATNLAPPIMWHNVSTNSLTTVGGLSVVDTFPDLPAAPPAAYYRLLIQ